MATRLYCRAQLDHRRGRHLLELLVDHSQHYDRVLAVFWHHDGGYVGGPPARRGERGR